MCYTDECIVCVTLMSVSRVCYTDECIYLCVTLNQAKRWCYTDGKDAADPAQVSDEYRVCYTDEYIMCVTLTSASCVLH